MRTTAARPEPIPVYAEMSSLNPVFIFPGAIAGNADEISALARQYVIAVTDSSGQLCTSPGPLFAPAGEAGDKLSAAVGRAVSACAGQTMLTEGIAGSWNAGATALCAAGNVTVVGQGTAGPTENAPAPTIFGTGIADFVSNDVLPVEIFGAASLVIRYSSIDELLEATNRLEGQLTASLQLTEVDYPTAAQLLPALEQKVGRIIVNGWPTGVEVGHAMVHGGPFPATSDTKTTSVGTLAINRFLRPVAYQNLPQELLPAPLQDANPWHLNRRIDGTVEAAADAKNKVNA
jgi:alpha-ketoglutaric semialdehyde dehydrogenase